MYIASKTIILSEKSGLSVKIAMNECHIVVANKPRLTITEKKARQHFKAIS